MCCQNWDILGRIRLTLYITIVSLNLPAYAQQLDESRFENISPTGMVYSVIDADVGFWFAAEGGIYRVVGNQVEHVNITRDNKHIVGFVPQIELDENNNLWLTNASDGLFVVTNDEYQVIDLNSRLDLPSAQPWALEYINNESMAVSFFDSIVFINTRSFELEKQDVTNQTVQLSGISMMESVDESLWIIDSSHLVYKLDVSTSEMVSFELGVESNGFEVTALLADEVNGIWVATTHGLYQKAANKSSFYKVANIPSEFESIIRLHGFSNIDIDRSGNIWLTSAQLFIKPAGSDHILLAENVAPFLDGAGLGYVNDVTESANGDILIAGAENGIVSISQEMMAIESVMPVSSQDFGQIYNVIPGDVGEFFVYSHRTMFYSYDGSQESEILRTDFPTSVNIAKDGSVYISDLANILHVVSPNTLDVASYTYTQLGMELELDQFVSDVVKIEESGELLVAINGDTDGYLYKGIAQQSLQRILSTNPIKAAVRMSNGDYVAVTSDSALHSTDGLTWDSYDLDADALGIGEADIIEDDNGLVWIVSSRSGLFSFDHALSKIEKKPLMLADSSAKLRSFFQDDEGYYWLSSKNGFFRMSEDVAEATKVGGESGIFDLDFEFYGIQRYAENQFTLIGDRSVYRINSDKLNRLLNQRIDERNVAKILHATFFDYSQKALKYDFANRKYLHDGYLELSYSDYLFTAQFASDNYAERKNLNFEYRLLGLDDKWMMSEAEDGTATYSTLPPGEYEFQVRVLDPRSVAEQPITSLRITVLPPWWRTWQAYLSYVLVILLGIFYFYRTRLNQVRRVNKELNSIVAERTSELLKSKNRVQGLLDQKKALFSSVSHEFRTPLTLITGPISQLLRTESDFSKQSILRTIQDNASRLKHLVDQLLELEQIDATADLPYSKYAINNVVRHIISSLSPLAESKRQEVKVELSGEPSAVLISDSLEKVLVNLLSNAIKYTPQGGQISVSVAEISGNAEITVADTGEGISSQDLERIFERFTRLDSATDQYGSGVGLAVVRELVEANHGSVNVRSILGEGTEFTVVLPLQQISSTDEVAPPSSAEYIEQVYSNTLEEKSAVLEVNNDNPLTVLLVEDHPALLEHLIDGLGDDYHCLTAANGKEGLEKSREAIPDLIISDVMMPIMDGFEMIEKLKDDALTSHIPVVLLTARGDDETKLTSLEKGVDDCIAKPFSFDELKLRMQQLLGIRDILKKRYASDVNVSLTDDDADAKVPRFSNDREQSFFNKFTEIIEANYSDEAFSRAHAASLLAVSERQLNRKLGAMIDHNFSEYLRKYRLKKSRSLLRDGSQITEVAYDVGFSSPSYFSSCFKAEYGLSPKQFCEDSFDS